MINKAERNDEPFVRQPDGNDDGINFDEEDGPVTCPHGVELPRNEIGAIVLARSVCDACKLADAERWKRLHTYE